MIRIYKSGIHLGEEALVAGNERSGMVNFSGCHLSCRFCYTPETSVLREGREHSAEEFLSLMKSLVEDGAKNINLISPTHVWNAIEPVLYSFRSLFPDVPIVLKTSGYESISQIKRFASCADVWVPDFKVWSGDLALRVGLPPDYGFVAQKAIARGLELFSPQWNEDQRIKRGLLVRHLLMPACGEDSRCVLQALLDVGYSGPLNWMSHFIDPSSHELLSADAEILDSLIYTAQRNGMRILKNGKQIQERQEECGT